MFNSKPEAPVPPSGNSEESGEQEDEGEASDAPEDTWQAPIGEGGDTNWRPEYADIRDDRVVLYGTLLREIGTFIYRVRATNAGAYNVPPPFAEGMYDRRLLARGSASLLQVVKP